MKILIAAATKRDWSLEVTMKNTFSELGHNVYLFDYRNRPSTFLSKIPVIKSQYVIATFRRFHPALDYKLVNAVKEFRPDFILVLKGESISANTIKYTRKKFDIPVVCWFPDDPQFHNFMSKYFYKAYDYYFSSSFITVEKLRKKGFKRIEYIAFGCNPDVYKKINVSKEDKLKYGADINFVGTFYFERWKYISKLKDQEIKIWGKWWEIPLKLSKMIEKYKGKGIYLHDMAKVFNSSKITLNIHLPAMKYGGMKSNMRNFEAAGCRAFVLCDKTVGISDLFTPDKEIVIYNDENELREKLSYYLKHDKERKIIAKNAQKHCYREHTYKHRAIQILKALKVN